MWVPKNRRKHGKREKAIKGEQDISNWDINERKEIELAGRHDMIS